jgi:hypothetical protein
MSNIANSLASGFCVYLCVMAGFAVLVSIFTRGDK